MMKADSNQAIVEGHGIGQPMLRRAGRLRPRLRTEIHTMACGNCHLQECQPRLLSTRRFLRKGEVLCARDQAVEGVYMVAGGSFKSHAARQVSDCRQIVGFHLPGELIGLDSLSSPHYQMTVTALEPALVCSLQMTDLLLQEQLIELLIEQVALEPLQARLTIHRGAEERLAAFFLNLAMRYAKAGLPCRAFRLPMSQIDIANYLDLTKETVSRILRSFREQRLLDLEEGILQLHDIPNLKAITHFGPEGPATRTLC